MDATAEYRILSGGKIVYINDFGEPFFECGGTVFKVSPETGEREEVCATARFDPLKLDDYWTGDSLKKEWEQANGGLPSEHWLVPITPFVLGGEFDPSNLMSIKISEAVGYYKTIRHALSSLPDGSKVEIKVKP